MDPITISLIAAGGGALLSLLGNAIAAGDDAKARQALQQIAQQYGPEYAQKIQAIHAPQLGPTAMEGLQQNQTGRNAQLKALAALQDTINSGGMTAGDKAALAGAENVAAARSSGDAATQMQNLAQRGQANSPAAAMLQMQAGQQGANTLGDMAGHAAVAAQQRRLQAIQEMGGLGGQLSQQDWQVQSDQARAHDAMSQWNANMSWQGQQERDALEQQRLAGLAGANQGLAANYGQSAQGTRQAWGGAGNAVNTAGSAYAQSQKGGTAGSQPSPTGNGQQGQAHQNPDGTWSWG